MRESIEWRSLDTGMTKDLLNERVMAIRGDGRVYAGVVTEANDVAVILTNGHHQQALPFTAYRYHVAVIKGPSPKIPKLAEKRLL